MTTAHEALIVLVCTTNGIGLHELSGIRDDSNMNKCYSLVRLRLFNDYSHRRKYYCLFVRNYGASMSKRDVAGMVLVPKAGLRQRRSSWTPL